MAPHKRNVKTHCSKDATPVKASTSRARKESPLVVGLKEDAKKVESPELLSFSPGFKPTQCDIEWAWKSPIGRTNDRSDTTSKRRLLSKTPISSTKRSLKANSPLNHFSLKRKLIKNEPMEIDDLSILTSQLQALAECHDDSLQSESRAVPSTCLTKSGPNEATAKPIELVSAMFGEDDSFDLLRCSQYIEQKLIENPEKVVFSPIQLNSPVRKNPRVTEMSSPKLNVSRAIIKATPKTPITPATSRESLNIASRITNEKNKQLKYNSPFPFHSKHSLPLPKCVTSMNNNIPNKSGDTKPSVNVTKSDVTIRGPDFKNKITHTMPPINGKNNATNNAEIDKTNKSDIGDDSFDAALLNFCEQNLDLMRERELISPKINVTNTNDKESSTSLNTKVSNEPVLMNPPSTSFTTLKNENKLSISLKSAEESNSNFDAALLAFCDENSELLSQTTIKLSQKDQPLALVPKLSSENESLKEAIKQVPQQMPLQTTASIATLNYKNQTSKTMEETPNNNLVNKCTASSIVSSRNKILICESSTEPFLIEPSNFDAALLAFCDQNTALMSQCTTKSPIITTISSSVDDMPDVKLPVQRDSGCCGVTTSSGESKSVPVSSNSLDDDFMQPDLLNLLESIESTSTHRPPSPPPLQCTPEEIEKKRKQARLKLEQKKKAMMDGINRLPNPFSNRKIQR